MEAGMRAVGAWAAAIGVLLAAACSSAAGPGSAQPAAGRTPATPAPPATGVHGNDAALSGHGELAFVSAGRLYLLGGSAPHLVQVRLPGLASAPSWSPDHRWLAVEVSPPPPAVTPYVPEPAALYVLRADGSGARPLTPRGWSTDEYAWSPARDVLAAAVSPHPFASQPTTGLLEVADPATGATRTLLTSPDITGIAWSGGGAMLAAGAAAGVGAPGSNGFHYVSRLETIRASGGRIRVVYSLSGTVLILAGWWPDGSGLLFWPDPQGSGSIAADGLPLDSIAIGAPRPRTLVASMLVHQSWIAFAPGGGALAAVSGGDREIWLGGKQITICQQSGACTPVAQPSGVVSLQPSWSPDGRLVFARASASGPFGPDGNADFSPAWIARWDATQRLWTTTGSGAAPAPVSVAGQGALDPVWGAGGALLFVRGDWLWLLPAASRAAEEVAGPLHASTGPTYYAYVPYAQLIAWTSAQPEVAAGSG
jgi:hypothetical protein